MPKNYKISVVMSVYNGEKYLKSTINSVLEQSYPGFEFIIINDGSTDNTIDILNSYRDRRIRVFNQDNKGLIRSLNKGISLASGEYIARQDADDISLPDRLKKQVELMDSDPSIVLVGSSSYLINEKDGFLGVGKVLEDDTEIRWRMLFNNAFAHTAVMMRSKILATHDLRYRESDIHAEDYGLWSKLIQFGICCNIGKPLVKKRVHSNQISVVFSEKQESTALSISKENIERIGLNVSDMDVLKKLRTWENNFPLYLRDGKDIDVCKLFITLLKKFKGSRHVDNEEYERIKKRYCNHIFNSINRKNINDVYSSRLLNELFFFGKLSFLKNLGYRSARRILAIRA